MRLLTDQDVFAVTVRFLRNLGHEVATAAQLSLAASSDDQLLQTAMHQRRILVTRDRDYGGLVFVHGFQCGVIYLRMLPLTLAAVHKELESVLTLYPEPVLLAAFVVVEAGRHRLRRLQP